MHYDPYESTDSKRRRIMSNIGIVIIIAAMITGIIFLVIPSGNQKRYDFKTIKTVELTVDRFTEGNSEFEALIEAVSASEHIIVGDSFKERFPTCHSLLLLDSTAYESSDALYGEDIEDITAVPYVKIGGGYITIAQSVVSTEKDCRDLLIMTYEAKAKSFDNVVNLSLGKFNCYTVRYNTRNPQIPLKLLIGKQAAMLDMYKIGISAIGNDPVAAEYGLTLNHAFESQKAKENLYHHIVFDPINESYGSADIVTNEETTDIKMRQEKNGLVRNENEIKYEIITSDKHLNLLNGVDFKFEFASLDNKIVITFN